MRRLILFDLDETLFDHRHASRAALDTLRQDHEAIRRRPIDDLEADAYSILERVHREVLAGLLTTAEARLERLRLLFAACGTTLDRDRLTGTAVRYRKAYQAARRPTAGAIPLLERIREEHAIGIVTNNVQREQEAKLVSCGLRGLVDFMVTFEEVGHPKPREEIFTAALDRAGVDASKAVMVGDSWETDVLGARRAGIRAVWYNPRGHRLPEPVSVTELESFLPTTAACRLILAG